MSGIINGFQAILSGIQTAWTIITNLFGAIGKAFIYIGNIESTLIGTIGLLPSWISGYMLATLLISILYIIIGRVGGRSS